MAETIIDGKPKRKQLSDQLDRLDSIIDTLAEGLPGAVADAAREGTRLAVKDAILEILSNPELRALLVPSTAAMPAKVSEPVPVPLTPAKPGLWSRMKTKVAAVTGTVAMAIGGVRALMASRVRAIRDGLAAAAKRAAVVIPVRRVLLVALGVGATAGVVCLATPHAVAGSVAAAGAVMVAMAAQIRARLRRSARWLGLA